MEEEKPTILVVEDNPSMLEIIAFLLEDEGYQVHPATSGEIALSLLERLQPDLIISDVMMPGMDGFEFYELVRANDVWSQIPFIFLTAKGQRTDVRRGMGLGADDYLTKPFEQEELLAAVKVRLARAAATRAAIDRASADLQEEIIQTLTHEFRTPLALVVGYTELLESSGQGMNDADFQTVLHGLYSGSERLMTLVEDFLLLSRLRTGSIAREVRQDPRQTISPERIVDYVMTQFESQAVAKGVVFRANHTVFGLTIAISEQHLTEVVRRLVDNAIKFSKDEGGQVVITTRQAGDFWALDVADNGIGIRREALSWIFEAFRQVDREKMEQQGPGVGLTIVRGLVEAYGGRATVKSTVGQGSIFTIALPLVDG